MANVISEKCPSCLAPLKYDSVKDEFRCEYCGNVYTIKQLEEYKNNKEVLGKLKLMDDMEGYTCSNCGAQIITGDNVASTSCVYCKNTAILKNRLTGLYAPSKIITFKYTKEDAINAFKKMCKGRLLIPNTFSDINNIQEMEGLYVPFWLYDCDNNVNMTARCCRITHWSDFSYNYTKTDTYHVTSKGNINFEKVPADGSSRFDDVIMNAIEPFDYKEFKDFNMSYLSGYISEKYDVDKDKSYNNILDRVKKDSKNYLLNNINGYSTKSIMSNNDDVKLNNVDYVLLPVWVLNIKFNDKIYHFAYNGQTGKIVGEIPVDRTKLLITILISFIVTFIVCLIVFLIKGFRW